MRILNRQYRGVDKITDVLSFPLNPPLPPFTKGGMGGLLTQNFVLGDVVINLHQAKRQTSQYGLTFNEELKKLLIHGLLHLIDYDHEKSRYHKVKMRAKEKELLASIR